MTIAVDADVGSLVVAAASRYIGSPSVHHSRFSTGVYFPEVDNLPRDLEVERFLGKVAGLKWSNNYYAYWSEAHNLHSVVGGFDCSLLVGQAIQDTFEALGIRASVPRHAAELYAWPLTVFVGTKKLNEGDLLFLHANINRSPPDHVGIYAGSGRIIHSPGVDDAKVENISIERFISGSNESMMTAKRLLKP